MLAQALHLFAHVRQSYQRDAYNPTNGGKFHNVRREKIDISRSLSSFFMWINERMVCIVSYSLDTSFLRSMVLNGGFTWTLRKVFNFMPLNHTCGSWMSATTRALFCNFCIVNMREHKLWDIFLISNTKHTYASVTLLPFFTPYFPCSWFTFLCLVLPKRLRWLNLIHLCMDKYLVTVILELRVWLLGSWWVCVTSPSLLRSLSSLLEPCRILEELV